MTSIQISALIFLICSEALLYWIGYCNGQADGRRHQPKPRPRRKAV